MMNEHEKTEKTHTKISDSVCKDLYSRLLKKHFLLLSMLKIVVLINMFANKCFFFHYSLMNRNVKTTAFI